MLAMHVPWLCAVIRLQSDVCRLNDIKYDFIGHFESLEADSKALLQQLQEHLSLKKSDVQELKPMAAADVESQLDTYYYGHAIRVVGNLYRSDMKSPLNSIKYTVPKKLLHLRAVT